MDNFIFDVDGTLIDSYEQIVDRMQLTLKAFSFHYEDDDIYKFIIAKSCSDFFKKVGKEHDIDANKLSKMYYLVQNDFSKIKLMPLVKETLSSLKEKGKKLFIYTHRGKSLEGILKNLGIFDYFLEIIDSTQNFLRKPSGEAVRYIVKKYQLDPTKTCYVGDRNLDILCAIDGGVKGVFYTSSGLPLSDATADYQIDSLFELLYL